MQLYRHVIFDFDGVLCDSLDAAMSEFNALCHQRNRVRAVVVSLERWSQLERELADRD